MHAGMHASGRAPQQACMQAVGHQSKHACKWAGTKAGRMQAVGHQSKQACKRAGTTASRHASGRAPQKACMQAVGHPSKQACKRAGTKASMHASGRAPKQACMQAVGHPSKHACKRSGTKASMHASGRAPKQAECKPASIQACMHACKQASIQAGRQAYMHACTHACARHHAGLPNNEVTAATALSSIIACTILGLFANLPFAIAPGMGMNAYLAFNQVRAHPNEWTGCGACVDGVSGGDAGTWQHSAMAKCS
eukprot:363885-Chlamydomonas_euryale.AAC.29